jgi:hypothetical protein
MPSLSIFISKIKKDKMMARILNESLEKGLNKIPYTNISLFYLILIKKHH